ncbi:MAG: lipid-A-disaccharide synthase-related protein [Halothece sp. Uz-M2-17]|nr:lipid-A-disaccharide synthase-related protein [Halothece sp. Uz-M2-17]
MKLLCLSNGHGEDVIAVRILEALRQQDPRVEITALPIVGDGIAYQRSRIPLITPGKTMPSGGFIYMDAKELWRDLRGGLIALTLAQLKAIRRWAKQGGLILAVGDIVPLLFAGLSGTDYCFVGTAKSEYYLRDEIGWLPKTSTLERKLGSVYLPWERCLMKTRRCRGVFPRDTLTTQVLQQFKIPAYDFGNPMMDGIVPEVPILEQSDLQRSLRILLLPGSRSPEAERNWQLILDAVESIIQREGKRRLSFFSAIAPSLNLDPFCESLQAQGWQPQTNPSTTSIIQDEQGLAFQKGTTPLFLTQNAYHSCLLASDLALAMAGTATEQFVGLGKPVIAFPGNGPQYTPAFAEAQTRLLGASVILVKKPAQAGEVFQELFTDPDRLQQIADNGTQRMGKSGAASCIAKYLLTLQK